MSYMDVGGLLQKYGLEQVVPMTGGEPHSYGDVREIDVKIVLTALTSTAGTIITGTDNLNFPAGYVLEEVEVINEVAATSGGSATLNIGLVRQDRTTEIDFDGFLALAPLADFNAVGERKTYTAGVTGIGALAGVTSGTNPGYLCANYGTAAFTAGTVTVRIRFRKL